MADRIDNPTGPGKTGNPGGAGGDRDIQPLGDEGGFGKGPDKSGAPKPRTTDKPDIGPGDGSSIPNSGN
jgi:hypothetical protein